MRRLAGQQLPLPLDVPSRWLEWSFIEAPSNQTALALLDRATAWPDHRLLLWGEPGSGKTHLLHRWARRHGGGPTDGPALRFPLALAPGLAIDDADLAPEEPLLHVLNARTEAGLPTLLAARAPPGRWQVRLPDLASRVRAMLAAELGPADDALLRALLARLFAERQLAVPEPVQAFLLLRLPREAAALREAAARLDRAALGAGGGVTRALAAAVVDEMERMWQPQSPQQGPS